MGITKRCPEGEIALDRKIAALAVGVLLALLLPAAPAHAAECAGDEVTITGTEEDDHIVGTEGRDVISALGGNDLIEELEPVDLICPGEGDDTIDGSEQTGPEPFATVVYQSASGPMEVDLLLGTAVGEGSDALVGIHSVIGSEFDDILLGSSDTDRLFGGPGDDQTSGREARDFLYGEEGDDQVNGGDGRDYIYGRNPVLEDIDGSDRGADALDGGDGNDRLFVFSGRDEVLGGAGRDHADFRPGDEFLVDLSRSRFEDEAGTGTIRNVENLEGWGHFIGDGGPNIIEMHGGSANGRRGGDLLSGRYGTELEGGRGTDILRGSDHSDLLRGGRGSDSLIGDNGDDRLFGGPGFDRAKAGPGRDVCRTERKEACER